LPAERGEAARYVAIITDGNGRWAQARGLPVGEGHRKLYKDGILRPHVGKIFSASDLADAHAFVEGRKAIGKVVVTW
jgi:NADPH:quinone reductase-like Zn-dependent oxidoreductase